MVTSERISVRGRSYRVCSVCCRPLTRGYGVCFPVGDPPPEPGLGVQQGLCRDHYLEQRIMKYPNDPLPVIPDNLLSLDSVKDLMEEIAALTPRQCGALVTVGADLGLLDRAVQSAKEGNWVESVQAAYDRLSGEKAPEVEMTFVLEESRGEWRESSAALAEATQRTKELEAQLQEAWGCTPEEMETRLAENIPIVSISPDPVGLSSEELEALQLVADPNWLSQAPGEEQERVKAIARKALSRLSENI